MLELKTPKEKAQNAHTLARSFELVHHRGVTYQPAHYETGDTAVPPSDRAETMWQPIGTNDVRRLAASQFDMLFANPADLSSFDFMVAQNSEWIDEVATSLLVRTEEGLRVIDQTGQLKPVSGEFVPNTLTPVLNEDQDKKDEVFAVVSQWLNSDEEAHALFRHLATSLAPGWSAVKYVLLLGEGRNGKSVLMKMVEKIFGRHNVSNVTRQAIAERSPNVLDLNGKLVNLVFDGQAEYLKDSGAEKTLIAGEPYPIRRLYDSTNTLVQTNALFIEGLNREPKSTDKSTALQKRLVRFHFPNVYAQDNRFERHMLEAEMLGAFLAVLLDHYVPQDEVAVLLAPTAKALELQLDHMFVNSIALQFLKHREESNTHGANGVLGKHLNEVVQEFQAWRINQNDLSGWAEPDVIAQLNPVLNTERVSARVDGQPRKVRVVRSFKPEALSFIESMKGDEDDIDIAALVED